MCDGRPVRTDRELGGSKACVLFSGIHNLATDDGQHRFKIFNFFHRDRKIIGRENGQISELPWRECSLLTIFRGEPTASHGVKLKRVPSVDAIFFRVKIQTTNCLTGDKPIQREEWVVTGDAGCIGPCSHGHTHLQHPPYWRCALRLLRAVTLNEILALESHAVLHCDATAQSLHTLDVAIRDRLAVIEEPMETVEWNFAVNFLVDVQCSRDRLVVSRMQAEWPPALD